MFIMREANSLNTAKYCFRENFDNFFAGGEQFEIFCLQSKIDLRGKGREC